MIVIHYFYVNAFYNWFSDKLINLLYMLVHLSKQFENIVWSVFKYKRIAISGYIVYIISRSKKYVLCKISKNK